MTQRKRLCVAAVLAAVMVVSVWAEAGDYEDLGSGWVESGGMTALGGALYIISEGTLYAVDTEGNYEDLGGGWVESGGMTALEGALYIISEGTLYAVEAK